MSGSAAFQRAKGLLAAWFDLTPDEAENLLLTWACENKMSACALATALVTDIHEGRPSGCSPAVVRYLETRLPEAAAVSDRTSARTRKHSAEAGTGWAWMRKNSSVDLSRGTGLLQLVGPVAPGHPTDREIKKIVVARLKENPHTKDDDIRVDVKQSAVSLGGEASSWLSKRAAGDDALETAGVVDVSNQLKPRS
jgi:hypothetical protein